MKVVKEYAEAMTARIDQSLLEAEGIFSDVLNENLLYASIFPGSNYDIQLVVADEDYDRACEILAATVTEETAEETGDSE